MTEPKPAQQYDTGAYHAALDCIDMHLAAAKKNIEDALAIIQGMRQSGYETVFNPLIDRTPFIEVVEDNVTVGYGIGLGGEERGE